MAMPTGLRHRSVWLAASSASKLPFLVTAYTMPAATAAETTLPSASVVHSSLPVLAAQTHKVSDDWLTRQTVSPSASTGVSDQSAGWLHNCRPVAAAIAYS